MTNTLTEKLDYITEREYELGGYYQGKVDDYYFYCLVEEFIIKFFPEHEDKLDKVRFDAELSLFNWAIYEFDGAPEEIMEELDITRREFYSLMRQLKTRYITDFNYQSPKDPYAWDAIINDVYDKWHTYVQPLLNMSGDEYYVRLRQCGFPDWDVICKERAAMRKLRFKRAFNSEATVMQQALAYYLTIFVPGSTYYPNKKDEQYAWMRYIQERMDMGDSSPVACKLRAASDANRFIYLFSRIEENRKWMYDCDGYYWKAPV